MGRRAMDVIYRTSGPSRSRVAFAFWYGKDGDINMPRYAVEGLMSAALVGKLEASTDEKCLGCSDQSVCFSTQTVVQKKMEDTVGIKKNNHVFQRKNASPPPGDSCLSTVSLLSGHAGPR